MTSVQNIRKPEDEGSKETFRTINNLKTSVVDFQNFAKLASAHAQAYRQLAVTGKQLVENLFMFTGKINSRCSDLSETWMLITANEKSIIDKYELLADAMENELAASVLEYQQTERNLITEFEKNYKNQHNKIIDDIRRAEKITKGAGKKTPAELQQAIQDLTNKLNAMKEHRKNSLEKVLQLERRKYCEYLAHWCTFVDTQIATLNDSLTTLKNNIPSWRAKANSSNDLSEEAVSLVRSMAIKERTATAISSSGSSADAYGYYDTQSDDSSSYSSSSYGSSYSEPLSSSATSSNDYYQDNSSYSDPNAGYYEQQGYAIQARALYDYTGTHGYELPFRAGDIITVTSQDEATGWWTGELNGQVGPFPGNYVELI